MSRENVEVVRQVFEAERRRDATTLNAVIDLNVEMDLSGSPFGDFAQQIPRHGRDEVQRAFREWYAPFENVEADVSELIDEGERVISVFTYRGRGRVSGVDVEFKDMAGLWTVRDGKVVRVEFFMSRDEALEAVGLRE